MNENVMINDAVGEKKCYCGERAHVSVCANTELIPICAKHFLLVGAAYFLQQKMPSVSDDIALYTAFGALREVEGKFMYEYKEKLNEH